METEGPSSSPAPEPARDGDAPASETTREDLERRLRLSESVALELERALEGKCRSLDESTRAAESLRRELRAARAANEADGSVPAAAMDAARAEIERLRSALVDGERERAALKSLASKAMKGAEGGRDGGDERDAMMNGDDHDARLRAAVAEERLAMAERALAEWREYASALGERCAVAEAAAADALRDARSASIRAKTETRAEALASAAGARVTRHENPRDDGTRAEDGGEPVPPPVPAQTRPPPPPPPPPPPYASEPSRVAFQRARIANGELAAALAAARSVARAAEEASTRAASALARASSLHARVDDGMGGARGGPKARVGKDVAVKLSNKSVQLPSVAEWAAAAAGRTASGEAFEARDGDWDRGDAMRVDWAKAAADAGEEGKEEGDEGKEEGDEGKEEGDEGKEEGDEGKAAGKDGGDGVDWVAKAAESRRAWAERRARGDIDPTLEKIASEY